MTTLEQKLADWFGPNWKAVLREQLASGVFVSQLAKEIHRRAEAEGLRGQIATSRPALSKLLNATDDDKAETQAARVEGGHALFEKALQAVEDLPANATKDEAAVARLKFEAAKWGAGKLNKEYDDKPDTNVQIASMGSLFVQAAARPGAVPPPKPAVVAKVEPTPAPPPALTTGQKIEQIKNEVEREEERRRLVRELMQGGMGILEAERAATQIEQDAKRPAPPPLPVKVLEAGEEPDD